MGMTGLLEPIDFVVFWQWEQPMTILHLLLFKMLSMETSPLLCLLTQTMKCTSMLMKKTTPLPHWYVNNYLSSVHRIYMDITEFVFFCLGSSSGDLGTTTRSHCVVFECQWRICHRWHHESPVQCIKHWSRRTIWNLLAGHIGKFIKPYENCVHDIHTSLPITTIIVYSRSL